MSQIDRREASVGLRNVRAVQYCNNATPTDLVGRCEASAEATGWCIKSERAEPVKHSTEPLLIANVNTRVANQPTRNVGQNVTIWSVQY